MSSQTDRPDRAKDTDGQRNGASVDEKLDERLRRLRWPQAPIEIRERALTAILARRHEGSGAGRGVEDPTLPD